MNEFNENCENHECEFRLKLFAIVFFSFCVVFLNDFQWSNRIRNNYVLYKQIDEMKNDNWNCKISCKRSNETREFRDENLMIESNDWVIVDNQLDIFNFDVENCRFENDELISKYCKK